MQATQPIPGSNKHELTPAARKLIEDRARRAADALNGHEAAAMLDELTAMADAPKVEKTATFTIHALMDDFPFDVQFSGSADQLAATVRKLRDLGAVPPTQAARAAVAEERERSAPICQYHGAMKESSKAPGTFYCPQKMGNGEYCKSKG